MFLFQFPTGWNSTVIQKVIHFLRKVSIPNGMEFYSGRRNSFEPIIRFQFPTGWNSTQNLKEEKWTLQVSIPNGMEFYYIACRRKLFAVGFNSQRDGILQWDDRAWLSTTLVSIPNGMKFYFAISIFRSSNTAFQFPTGWNSTLFNFSPLIFRKAVSIPNGMKFY